MRTLQNERLENFESMQHISILDALDVPARLDEFRGLQDGWLDGRGRAPAHNGLDWLSQAFEQNYPYDLSLPYLYPTAEGGVQAEWSLGSQEISLEIDLLQHTGEWHNLNMTTHADEMEVLNLDDPEEWEWLVRHLRNQVGGAT